MAAISDKITKTMNGQNPNTTFVASPRVMGATDLRARNLDGWPEDTAVHFTTYRIDSQGELVEGSQTDWKGVVNQSANTIANLTRTGGAPDQGNSADDIIEPMPTASWGNDLAEALLKHHTTEGDLKPKTVELSKINGGAKAGVITTDANGNIETKEKIGADNIDFATFPDYKTDKIDTGRKWINGKTIYRQVFIGSVSIAANTRYSQILTANVDSIISCGGWFLESENSVSTGVKISVPGVRHGGDGTITGSGSILKTNEGIFFSTISSFIRVASPFEVWVEFTEN